MLRIDVLAVAEVEAGLGVQHDGVAVEQVVVQLVQVALVTRQPVHLGHHRHHHVERVGPPPVVVGFRARLVAHHLTGPRHLTLVGRQLVEVDVGLETYLPVAEEHVVLAFAVVLVFPLGRVGLGGSLPLVVLGPARAVVQHLLVVQQFIHFDVAGVVGGVVPEGAHLGLVVRLPVGVHLADDVFHFVCRPLPGLGSESGQQGDGNDA